MRFISWNVNGLRAAVGKGFSEYFKEADADIFSLQETKLQAGQIDLETVAIINTGIMPKGRAIPVLRYSRSRSRFLLPMVLAWRSMTTRGV